MRRAFMLGCFGLLGWACDDAPKAAPPPPKALLVVTEAGVGGIGARTPSTLDAIRPLFPAFDVRAESTGGSERGRGPSDVPEGQHVEVYSGTERLFSVVPGLATTGILFVDVASPQITTEAGLRVGMTLSKVDALAGCTCVGDGLLCYGRGSHVGVGITEDCHTEWEESVKWYRALADGNRGALDKLRGRKIAFLRWAPVVLSEYAR